jgi:hypothetical protein
MTEKQRQFIEKKEGAIEMINNLDITNERSGFILLTIDGKEKTAGGAIHIGEEEATIAVLQLVSRHPNILDGVMSKMMEKMMGGE